MSKPSPDKTYGPILADLFQQLCKDILKETGARDCRVSGDFNYRDAKGRLKMNIFVTPEGESERALEKEARRAQKVHGPILTKPLTQFCEQTFSERKASGIRFAFEFIFKNGEGNLILKTFTTPDGKTERMLDGEVLMPRGAKLQHEAHGAMRKAFVLISGCDTV